MYTHLRGSPDDNNDIFWTMEVYYLSLLFYLVREWIPGTSTESVNYLDCKRVNIYWSVYKLVKSDVGASSFFIK